MAIWNRNGAVRVVESTRAEGPERLAPGDSRQRRKTRQSKVSNEGLALTALREWRPLAEQGNANAQFNLGTMYANGQGVPQGDTQAHMWFNLAASRFPPGEDRDKAVKYRDIVAKMMTPAQISEAQKLAREWKPK